MEWNHLVVPHTILVYSEVASVLLDIARVVLPLIIFDSFYRERHFEIHFVYVKLFIGKEFIWKHALTHNWVIIVGEILRFH